MATIILKATEKCNSNCYYCDVVRKKGTGQSMSLTVLEKLYERIHEFLETNKNENLDILWHGGEPLLLGPEYYWQAIKLQEKYVGQQKNRIRHSIQTNLTCFTEEFVEIFKELGINAVGTSYDPEPNMRGPGAKIDTLQYNNAFMKALEILEKNGIGYGIIYVVTRKSLENPLGVFHFLTNFILSGGINFNPVLIYDNERKNIAITADEFADFLGQIFPVWWENRSRYMEVEPFNSFIKNIVDGNRELSCVDSGSCTYHHINIAPNGDASQCGRSSDWGLLDYGNIAKNSLDEIIHHQERQKLENRYKIIKNSDCKECRFWSICHGGCPLDSWSVHQDFNYKSEWCAAKKGFLEKYFEPITGVTFNAC
jgi:uncharacterized protein